MELNFHRFLCLQQLWHSLHPNHFPLNQRQESPIPHPRPHHKQQQQSGQRQFPIPLPLLLCLAVEQLRETFIQQGITFQYIFICSIEYRYKCNRF